MRQTFKQSLFSLAVFGHCLAYALAPSAAAAQGGDAAASWPGGSVRLIVGYPAGGSVDVVARALAAGMAAKLGESVIVENRVGADGVIGMSAVSRAEPNGRTLGVSLKGAMTAAPFTMKLPFDTLTDFTPISGIAQTAEIFVTRQRTGMRSLGDVAAAAKRNGRALTIGYIGALPRLTAMLLAQQTGAELLPVPYKGLPAALQDLMGDQIDMVVGDAVGVLAEQVKAGKLVPLAVTSAERWSALADVPTTREVGIAALEGNQWYALYGPKSMSPALAERVNRLVAEVLKDPSTLQQLGAAGLQPYETTPQALAEQMRRDTLTWKEVAAKANIVPE